MPTDQRGDGLSTFSMHAFDSRSSTMFDDLRDERGGDADLGAPAGGEDLSDLDPETAARRHLDQVLASVAVPALTATVAGSATRFSSLGATTVPLDLDAHGQVPPDSGRHPDLRVARHGRAGRGQRPGQHRLRPG